MVVGKQCILQVNTFCSKQSSLQSIIGGVDYPNGGGQMKEKFMKADLSREHVLW